MPLRRLWLTDFRNYISADVTFSEGMTAITGLNGQGKTNLVEAIAWLSRGSSFRGAPNEVLIRNGSESAVLRAETGDGDRSTLLEVELAVKGRNRMQVNGNKVGRVRDLVGYFTATIFGPDDLSLVKGGPSERRTFLDDLLVDLDPRLHSTRINLERVLRQRNTLLRQAGGQLTPEVGNSLDVWDSKLAEVGEVVIVARQRLVDKLSPLVNDYLGVLSGGASNASLAYEKSWLGSDLAVALNEARLDDLRRGTTTVGPHRDDVRVSLDDLGARHHSSQGEQRSLALAMRLAGHCLVDKHTGVRPVVLLDDVFSELDPDRSAALVALLPKTQAVLTSAGELPPGVVVDHQYRIAAGRVEAQ
jgi:DNA replication and repair protein RecF